MAVVLLAIGGGFQARPQQSQPQEKHQEPPEEDESYREREYAFNPLQASKEFKVGEFYFKKGSWKAAAGRFEEATKWNPGYAEAYLKLGESLERLKEADEARAAYEKFLEVAPDHKKADEIRKKLARKDLAQQRRR